MTRSRWVRVVLPVLAIVAVLAAVGVTRLVRSGPTCADARGVPSSGVYVGAAVGGNSDPTALEQAAGGALGVRRTYFAADQVDRALRIAAADLAAGRLPWLSFKFPRSWQEMARGDGDQWVRDLADRLRALGGPVWVAFHHEPEGDGDVQAWRSAQERVAPMVRSAAPNVAFTVILTGWNQFIGPTEYALSRIWPATEVDVAGFDVYNSVGIESAGKQTAKSDPVPDYVARISEWAGQNEQAWAISESGYTSAAGSQDPDWVSSTVERVGAAGGVAFVYFDSNINSKADWRLGTPSRIADFGTALATSARVSQCPRTG